MIQGAINGVLSKPGHIVVRSPQSPCSPSYPSATSPSPKHEHMVEGMRMKEFDVKRCSIPMPISNPTSKRQFHIFQKASHSQAGLPTLCIKSNPTINKPTNDTQEEHNPKSHETAESQQTHTRNEKETKVNLQCSFLVFFCETLRERARKAALKSRRNYKRCP